MNILRFEMNVPTNVALESPEGVPVEGRYGKRMMFTLTDGRVMYVPPIVAGKIEAAGIVPGERFDLCKSVVRTGLSRSVEWLLERAGPERDREPGDCAVPVATETPLEHDLRLSVEMANASRAGSEPPRDSVEETPFASGIGPKISNGNGSAPKPIALLPSPPVTKLEHALKTAISAAYNAEKFGAELGYVVRFDADAIKSMAITVLINMSERPPR